MELTNTNIRPALVATLGLSPEILDYELNLGWQNQPFQWLTIITTPQAREGVTQIEWLKANPACYNIIADIEDNPGFASDLTNVAIREVELLRSKGFYVVAEPTGGRKWMSAAFAAAASILKVPTIYVNAKFTSDGKADPDTMQRMDMTSVLDAVAHLELKRIETTWAARDFPSTIALCKELASTGVTAFLRELGSTLALTAATIHDIDRFEPYRKDKQPSLFFENAIGILDRLDKLIKEWKTPLFNEWTKSFKEYLVVHASHVEEDIYTLGWLYGLLANAQTYIDVGRYDDAVARINAVLEWSAKVALKIDYGVQIDDSHLPNGLERYDETVIGSTILNHIDKSYSDKPGGIYHLGLSRCVRLVRLLNELDSARPITIDFRNVLQSYCAAGTKKTADWVRDFHPFIDFVDKRNRSVLAHGREAVSKELADKFLNLCIKYLSALTGKDVSAEVKKHILSPPPLT